ncbi:MAG: S1 RNA-binding domain-containing protein [Vicinamibacterales bacterium]
MTTAAMEERRAIDDLLDYYAMLEVACLAGCIESQPPANVAELARRHLFRPSLVRYYTHYYPLALPQLFAQRLKGVGGRTRVEPAYEAFVQFLHVTRQCGGEPVDTFLGMLDGGTTRDGFNLRDVIKLVGSGEELVGHLATIPETHTSLETGTRGLLQFLQFCRAADQLLAGIQANPVLQPAFWHYHAYWFQQIGVQLTGVLGTVIEAYRDYVAEANDDRERQMAVTTHADMDEAHRALRRLVSGIYSAELDRRLWGAQTVAIASVTAVAAREPHVSADATEQPATEQPVDRDATRVTTIRVPADKILDVVGKTIRSIIERTGVKIDIDDDLVSIRSADDAALQKAISIIQELTAAPVLNKTYMGKIQRITDFGAFVEIMPGTDGLLHISELAGHRVQNVRDEVKEGEQVLVKVIKIDPMGWVSLSRKSLSAGTRPSPETVHGAPSTATEE